MTELLQTVLQAHGGVERAGPRQRVRATGDRQDPPAPH